MSNEIIVRRVSRWQHIASGKICAVVSKNKGGAVSEFSILGYNPLPCMTFQGTYTILAKWLQENGWVRLVNLSAPDLVYVEYK